MLKRERSRVKKALISYSIWQTYGEVSLKFIIEVEKEGRFTS